MDLDKTILDSLVKKLLELKEDVRDNMEYRIKEASEYKELMEIPQDKLPLHINDYDPDSAKHFIIKCRLSGEDPFKKDLAKCSEILYDVAFDMEAYTNIGYNDGLATAVSMLLNIAGLEKEATQALEATYSCD